MIGWSSKLIAWLEESMSCKISDYESCAICGYDHAYDFPMLSDSELTEAEVKHIEYDYEVVENKDYPGQ